MSSVQCWRWRPHPERCLKHLAAAATLRCQACNLGNGGSISGTGSKVSSPPLPVHPSPSLPTLPWVAWPIAAAAGTMLLHISLFGPSEPCLHYMHCNRPILNAFRCSHVVSLGQSYVLVSCHYFVRNLWEISWVEPTTKLFYSENLPNLMPMHAYLYCTLKLGNMPYTYVHTYAQTHTHMTSSGCCSGYSRRRGYWKSKWFMHAAIKRPTSHNQSQPDHPYSQPRHNSMLAQVVNSLLNLIFPCLVPTEREVRRRGIGWGRGCEGSWEVCDWRWLRGA